MFFVFFFAISVFSETDEKDFWDEIADEEVVVESSVEGKLYSKARFDIPIKRRLRLYPEVGKIVSALHGMSNIEFIYEAKKPTLIFLDSQDVIVEQMDISKMNQDEIRAILNLRGFAVIGEEYDQLADSDPQTSTQEEAKPETEEVNL